MAKNVQREIIGALGLADCRVTRLEMKMEHGKPVMLSVHMLAPFVANDAALDRFTETLKQFELVEAKEPSVPSFDEETH
jgi:hypothetical protein